MKNIKFLTLFIFMIIFTIPSCELGGLFPTGDNPTGDNPTGDNPNLNIPGEVLEKNTTQTMSIQASDLEGPVDGDSYFFIAGNGDHTISLTNLTTDVDVELYEWDGTQTVDEIILDYIDSPFFLDESRFIGLDSETITTSSLVSGKPYFIFVTEWNETDGTYDLLISNP